MRRHLLPPLGTHPREGPPGFARPGLFTSAERNSLTALVHRSPNTLLGMHPLGDGSGIVARAHLPGAAQVELVPVHDKTQPKLVLKRLGDTAVFEGPKSG